ncbi:hypothetical protein, partial [Nonlabens ulvanivorans]
MITKLVNASHILIAFLGIIVDYTTFGIQQNIMTETSPLKLTELYKNNLDTDTLINLYKRMLLPRLIEEKMLI